MELSDTMDPYFQKLKERFCAELKNPSFSDFTVVVEESEFKCHRLILATFSRFFQKMFESDMKETEERKATLGNMSCLIFDKILKWMYFSDSILDKNSVFYFVAAADQLDMPELMSEGKQLISSLLNEKRFLIKIFKISSKHQWHELKEKTWKEINEHWTDIPFAEMSRLEYDEMKLLLCSPTLSVKTEDFVIRIVLQWVDFEKSHRFLSTEDSDPSDLDDDYNEEELKCETNSRAEVLPYLLRSCRYHLINSTCLWQDLECNKFVKSDPECFAILRRIVQYKTQPNIEQSQCLSGAMHRKSSSMKNYILTCTSQGPMYITLSSDGVHLHWEKMAEPIFAPPPAGVTHLSFYDNVIYSLCPGGLFGLKYDFTTTNVPKAYVLIAACTGQFSAMVPIGNKMVALKVEKDKFDVLSITLGHLHAQKWHNVFEGMTNDMFEVSCVTHIGSCLIIFWKYNQEITNIECISLFENCTSSNFDMPSNFDCKSGLVAFHHYTDTFILQDNGALWKVNYDAQIKELTLEPLSTFWIDGLKDLYGAMLVNQELWLFQPEESFSGSVNVEWNRMPDKDELATSSNSKLTPNDQKKMVKKPSCKDSTNVQGDYENMFHRIRWCPSPKSTTGYVHAIV